MCHRQVDSQMCRSCKMAKLSHLKSFLHAKSSRNYSTLVGKLKLRFEMFYWKLERKVSCFAMQPMKSPVSRAQARDEIRRVPGATWSTMFCCSLASLLFLYYLWAPFEGDVERPESKHRDGHKQLYKTLSFALLHRIARFWLWFVKGGDWTRSKKKRQLTTSRKRKTSSRQ